MAMDNFLGNAIANVKIATLIIGVIDIGFLGHSFYTIGKEEAYLSAVIICFIISFLCTMAIIVGLLNMENENLAKADMLYHMVACLFYLITLIIFFVSLVEIGNKKWGKPLWERIIAFILGVVNTILYGFIGWLYYRR